MLGRRPSAAELGELMGRRVRESGLAGRRRGERVVPSFLPAAAAPQAARAPRRRRRLPNMAAPADVTRGCGTAGAGLAHGGAGSGGPGSADRGRCRTLGSAPALSPASASLRRLSRGPRSMSCPPSFRLSLRVSRNQGWSHESGTWTCEGARLSASCCALSSPDTTTLGAGLGWAGRNQLGVQGPQETQKGLGLPQMRARRGRADPDPSEAATALE